MALNDEDVREILRIIDESDLAELKIETEGFVLHVRRGAATETMSSPEGSTAPRSQPAQPGPEHHTPPATTSATDRHDGKLTIESPMLGTFYRAEGPGQTPFVEVGSQVEPDTTVCIIEVMKMMNSVPAGVAGTIAEICHENSQLVEYGAPLFRVEPAT
jgi:acetyl-CoA carboxylase biotin carboxyl carrier protein